LVKKIMIYNDLIPQKKVWEELLLKADKNKIPNAMIFHGVKGIGKEAHAMEFSAYLNCSQKNESSACGNCPSCMKTIKFQHEDIYHILPLPTSRKKTDDPIENLDTKSLDELNALYLKKSKDPYQAIELEKANTILLNSIRYLKKKLYLTSSSSNWNIVIITEAEKLCIPNSQPANALLKILEEPPDRTIFILTTSNYNQIIDTIKSRCQPIYFSKIKKEDIISKYSEKNKKEDINLAYNLFCGNLNLINKNINDIDEIKNNLEAVTNAIITEELSNWSILLEQKNSKQKNTMISHLTLMTIVFRDFSFISQCKSFNHLLVPHMTDIYLNKIQNFPNANWSECINIVESTIENLNRNINPELELYSFLMNINDCLKGKLINRLAS